MPSKQEASGGTHDADLRGPRDMAKARLLEPQSPVTTSGVPRFTVLTHGATDIRRRGQGRPEPSGQWAAENDSAQGDGRGAYVTLYVSC